MVILTRVGDNDRSTSVLIITKQHHTIRTTKLTLLFLQSFVTNALPKLSLSPKGRKHTRNKTLLSHSETCKKKKKLQTQTQWKQREKERDGFGNSGRSSPTHNSIQLNSQRHSHSCLCQQQAQVFGLWRHPLVQILLPRTRSQWTHWSSWKSHPFFQG